MRAEQTRDLLIQSADLLLDQLQVLQCHFHEPTVDRVELGAGAQGVAQLCRCGTQALIGQGGQSRRIFIRFRGPSARADS
jgi:hypothetical protein